VSWKKWILAKAFRNCERKNLVHNFPIACVDEGFINTHGNLGTDGSLHTPELVT
jgi:hypothetical protein